MSKSFRYKFLFVWLFLIFVGNNNLGLAASTALEDFNEFKKQRYDNLDLKFKRGAEDAFTLPDAQEFLGRQIGEGQRLFGSRELAGFRLFRKNICAMKVSFVTDTGELLSSNPNILFLSGSARGRDLADFKIPDGREIELPNFIPISAIKLFSSQESLLEFRARDVDPKIFYCFDSHRDESARLERLLELVLNNMELYSGSAELRFERRGERVILRGDEAILSAVSSILKDSRHRDLVERLKEITPLTILMEEGRKSGKIKDIHRGAAYNFIRTLFAHSEQAALEFFHHHYEDLVRSALERKIPDTNPRVVGHIIDIFTQRDMCNNCHKTMYIKTRGGGLLVRVIGGQDYFGSRAGINRNPNIPPIDLRDIRNLYVKNV